jgi:hypothetical protein
MTDILNTTWFDDDLDIDDPEGGNIDLGNLGSLSSGGGGGNSGNSGADSAEE